MKIYAIRHSQTKWHLEKRLQGHKNSSLTEYGKKTSIKLGNTLKNKGISEIISSDLGRCVETTKIIAEIIKVPTQYTNKLREQNFGEFNGENKELVKEKIDLNDPELKPEGGESFNEMKERVIQYLNTIKKDHKDKIILLVIHDGGVRTLLSQAHNCKFTDPKCKTSTSTISEFEIGDGGIKLKSHLALLKK